VDDTSARVASSPSVTTMNWNAETDEVGPTSPQGQRHPPEKFVGPKSAGSRLEKCDQDVSPAADGRLLLLTKSRSSLLGYAERTWRVGAKHMASASRAQSK